MNPKQRALNDNITTYDIWLDYLTTLAVSRLSGHFPATVDPLYVEHELFYNGRVIFFIADNSLVAFSGFGSSQPNPYGIPLKRTVNAKNGFTATLTNENSVIMYNNVLKKPGINTAIMYARRLAELDRIIDLNTAAQKTPFLVRSSKESELSVKNAFAAVDNDEALIAVTEDFMPEAIQVLHTDAPFTAPQIKALQQTILNEYLLTLGIGSANTQKPERLITSEVAASNSGLFVFQQSVLKARQIACDEINRRFGAYLDEPVSYEFNADVLDYIVRPTPEVIENE